LNYANAWVILCRLPLLFLVRERLKKAFVDPDSELLNDGRVGRLVGSCVEAAQRMIGLFETLRHTHSLAKFSFTDFQGCSTATIILLLHSILEGSIPQSPLIKSGLSCLKYMASGNEDAKVGVRFVEEFQALTNEAPAKVRERFTREDTSPQHTSGMTAYEEWLLQIAPDTSMVSGPVNQPAIAASSMNCGAIQLREHVDQTHVGIPSNEATNPSPSARVFGHFSDETLINHHTAEEPSDTNHCSINGFDIEHPNLEDSFILGLTGLDALGFTDQTYWL